MLRGQMKSRHFVVAFLALVFGCLAVGIPLVLNVGQEFEFERAELVAGTRDTYTITRPIPLVASVGAVVAGGQLSAEVPRNKPMKSQRALQMLKRGLADLVIDRGVLRLGDEEGPRDSASAEHPSPTVTALIKGKFLGLKLVRSTVMVALPGGGSERFSKVNANFARIGRTAIRGTGEAIWRGQKIKFALRSDGNPTVKGLPFEIAFGGKLVAFKLSGAASSDKGLRIKGDSEIKIPDLRRLSRALGAHWPGHLNLHDVTVSGPMVWSGPVLSFPKAKVGFGKNEGNGVLSVNTASGKAVLSGTLAFDDFDLGACFGPVEISGGGYSTALVSKWVQRLAGAWSIPMARNVDADLRVSAKRVRVGPTSIGSAATAITLKSGKVSVNLAELAFEGGSGTGQLSIDFNGLVPQLALRGRVTTAPLEQLSKALVGVSYLRGSGTFTADLIAYGDTLKHMLANVSGTIDAEMPDGGTVSLDLMALKREQENEIARQPLSGRVLMERALRRPTRLDHASASFLLSGGRIRTNHARAQFAAHVAHMAGQFDTKLQQMEFKILVARRPKSATASHGVIKGPKTPRPAASAALGITGDLLVARGSWDAPHLQVSRHHAATFGQLDTLLRLSPRSLMRTRM
jgi:AsmA family